MKKGLIFVFLVMMVLMMAQGCHWWWDDDDDCCEDHDGVAMCYRPTDASHGHIMCRDGYTCHEECY